MQKALFFKEKCFRELLLMIIIFILNAMNYMVKIWEMKQN